MPGPSVHTRLVTETVERWRRSGRAPVDLSAPGVMEALRLGSVAPDAGYYPGADPFLTDLAHYIRSGELTRNLLKAASTAVERAFAWGWATHVEADALIHPEINRATGELRGTAETLTYADDAAGHVRVELGLDAFYHARFGTPALTRAPGPGTGFMARAYERTYGIEVDERALRGALDAAIRYHGVLSAIKRLSHAGFTGGMAAAPARAALVVGRALARLAPGDAPLAAVFHGVAPSGSLSAGVERAAAEYHVRMEQRVASGLRDLPDYNLDTGVAGQAVEAYRLAASAEHKLNRYRGT